MPTFYLVVATFVLAVYAACGVSALVRRRKYVSVRIERLNALAWAHGRSLARRAVQSAVPAHAASDPLDRRNRGNLRCVLAEQALFIDSDPIDPLAHVRLAGFYSCADRVLAVLDEAGAREVLSARPLPLWAAVEAAQETEYDHA